jgi:hypothetical protein
MKKKFMTRMVAGLALGAALAGPAHADVLYSYTAPVADTATTIIDGMFELRAHAGTGPLFSLSFRRAGNAVASLTAAELNGLDFLLTYEGIATHFTYLMNPDDSEQPFLEFEAGNSARPSAWDWHALVEVAGIGPLFFETTSSFDYTTRATGPGELLAISAGTPGETAGHGVWRVAQVPEPGMPSLLVLGAALLWASRRWSGRA